MHVHRARLHLARASSPHPLQELLAIHRTAAVDREVAQHTRFEVGELDRPAVVELAEKARSGKLGMNDLQGGTFSISSLGNIGGTGFTPIINAPEVAILGVSVDTEGPEVVRAYVEKHGASYPILLGSEKLARQFGAPGFPALILVGPEGGIEQIHVGLIEAPELREAIAALRGDPAPAAADGPA